MDLSIGGLAGAAAEFLTGSEFAGDVVKTAVSFGTGDIGGGIDGLCDAAENVVDFATDPRTQAAAGDAFGTGATRDPGQCTPASGGAAPEGTEAPVGGGSLEDRIFALLLKMLEKAEGKLEEEVTATEAKGSDAGDAQLQKMQRANDKVKQLNQLVTGLLQAFNESAMASIRNIR